MVNHFSSSLSSGANSENLNLLIENEVDNNSNNNNINNNFNNILKNKESNLKENGNLEFEINEKNY